MPVDLTAAGHRALETLDSVTDMQSMLKVVNLKQDIINLQRLLAESANASKRVEEFIRDNPNVEAEILRPPLTNFPGNYYSPSLAVGPFASDPFTSTLSDPVSVNTLSSSSKLFHLSVGGVGVLVGGVWGKPINNNFLYLIFTNGFDTVRKREENAG